MTSTLIITFILLIITALVGKRVSKLPKNIWLLFVAQPLAASSFPIIVLAGGILGAKMAPQPELSTLPITLTILGTALAVIPASMLMKFIGRKKGTMFGFSVAIIGTLLIMLAAIQDSFTLMCVGTVLVGMSMSFAVQLRFAAIESLEDPTLMPQAISILMASGLFAAVLGPEIAVVAAQWIDSPHGFAGSFLALAVLFFIAILIISQLDHTVVVETETDSEARKLTTIIKQPIFIIAISASAIAYSVMSYVMTATPLSMHEFHEYDLDSVKWVVQSHILAMYLPSLFSAFLINKLGITRLMTLGSVIYVFVVIVALIGHSVMHYWWAMVLLGIGWNLLFLCGTLLLPEVYQANERFKVQAINDFGIFFIQALASLSAGVILFSQGWSVLISITIPIIFLMFIMTLWFYLIKVKDNNLQQDLTYEE